MLLTLRRGWSAFARWRRQRPFWGALLIVLGALEIYLTAHLDLRLGQLHVQLGVSGLQSTVIPAVLALLGVLIALTPQHRVFYGIVALVVGLYAIVGVNLGGFFIGTVLTLVGGILAVAWLAAPAAAGADARDGEAGDTDVASGATAGEAASETETGADTAREALADAGRIDDPGEAAPDEEPEADQADDVSRRRRQRAAHRGAAALLVGVAAIGAGGLTAPPAHAEVPCLISVLCAPAPAKSTPPVSGIAPATPIATAPKPAATPKPSPAAPSTAPTSSTAPAPSAGASAGGAPSADAVAPAGAAVTAPPAPTATSTLAPSDASTDEPEPPGPGELDLPLLALGADTSHGTFTTPSADLTGKTLSIEGLSRVGLVTVPVAGGGATPALRLECSRLEIDGFSLSTRNRGAGVLTTSNTMILTGHVTVWLDRIGGSLGDGSTVSLGLAGLPGTLSVPTLLISPQLGLVGVQADRLQLDGFDEITGDPIG